MKQHYDAQDDDMKPCLIHITINMFNNTCLIYPYDLFIKALLKNAFYYLCFKILPKTILNMPDIFSLVSLWFSSLQRFTGVILVCSSTIRIIFALQI